MRPPRYRFPNEVREATRTMASRMTRDGTAATTPEELDAWIARDADVQAVLVHGGYGTKFTSADLQPLLEVFLAQHREPAAAEKPVRRGLGTRWLMVLAIVVLFGLLLLAFL